MTLWLVFHGWLHRRVRMAGGWLYDINGWDDYHDGGVELLALIRFWDFGDKIHTFAFTLPLG